MGKTRIGFAGTGNIGRVHLEAFGSVADAEIAAVCDVQREVADEAAKGCGAPRTFYRLEDLMASPDIDAVVIAVPPYMHERACVMAAENGKHALCEKPMAMTAAQAESMAEACARHGVKLELGFCNRFIPEIETMREFIESGAIGSVFFANTSSLRQRGTPYGWYTDSRKSGGGSLLDCGVHMLDVAWYLMGRPKAVAAKALNYDRIKSKFGKGGPLSGYIAYEKGDAHDVEDSSFGVVTFENGVGLTYQNSWVYNGREVELYVDIQADKGGMRLNGYSLAELTIYRDELGYLTETKPPVEQRDCYLKQAEHFVKVVRGEVAQRSPGEDGVAVQRMLEGLYQSARLGKEVKL
jgi:predicted dehydrogenase